jgi:hypothetical protein
MAHYLIEGKKYPAVDRPLTGEIMYGEKAVGKDLKEFSGVEQMVMSALIALRRDPEARVRYNWDTLMEIPFDQLVPISDVQDEQPVEMVPDPTARGDETERSGLFESTPNPAPSAGTGNIFSTSDTTSGGHPKP